MNGYSATLAGTADLLRLVGDPSRARILALLEREELTVAEMTAVTGLAQSRVSTHLARLKEAGLVLDRRAGTSAFYRINEPGMPEEARRLWRLFRETARDPLLAEDERRAAETVAARGSDTAEGRIERCYTPGRSWEALLRALLGFLDLGDLIDIGCGDCAVAEILATRARSVTCVDRNGATLHAAAGRLAGTPNVRIRRADMHALPFAPASFSEAMLLHCLEFSEEPETALAEAARVLRPGGRLVAATLHAHAHEAAGDYGHVRRGFRPEELAAAATGAGLAVETCARTSRERRAPNFEIVTLYARRPA